MRSNHIILIIFAIIFLVSPDDIVFAHCIVPNQLTNGQPADASLVMDDLNAIVSCIENPAPTKRVQLSGSGGGVTTLQSPSTVAGYNFNFPATAGNMGDLLTSGGGGSNPSTWTPSGTSGHALPYLDGNNTWSGTQTFGAVIGTVTTQAGSAYTVAQSDCGTTLVFTSASPVTLTTLATLPAGCSIAVEQAGNGQVAIVAGTNTTQHSAHGFTKTYGPYAILGLFVDANTGGTAADVVITGDGA